jgi:hypothetical protein
MFHFWRDPPRASIRLPLTYLSSGDSTLESAWGTNGSDTHQNGIYSLIQFLTHRTKIFFCSLQNTATHS